MQVPVGRFSLDQDGRIILSPHETTAFHPRGAQGVYYIVHLSPWGDAPDRRVLHLLSAHLGMPAWMKDPDRKACHLMDTQNRLLENAPYLQDKIKHIHWRVDAKSFHQSQALAIGPFHKDAEAAGSKLRQILGTSSSCIKIDIIDSRPIDMAVASPRWPSYQEKYRISLDGVQTKQKGLYRTGFGAICCVVHENAVHHNFPTYGTATPMVQLDNC